MEDSGDTAGNVRDGSVVAYNLRFVACDRLGSATRSRAVASSSRDRLSAREKIEGGVVPGRCKLAFNARARARFEVTSTRGKLWPGERERAGGKFMVEPVC